MGLSNKMLLGIAGGAATLALVGVGAGASFTDSANVASQFNTGTLAMEVNATGQALPSFTDVNNTATGNFVWLPQNKVCATGSICITDVTDSTSNSPHDGNQSGFTLGSLGNLGSEATETLPFWALNQGSLDIKSLELTVSDPSHDTNALSADTEMTVYAAPSLSDTYQKGAEVVGTPITLTTTELNNGVSLPLPNNDIPATSPVGTGLPMFYTIVLSPVGGSYSNTDEVETISPTFTLTASDQS